MPWRKDIHSDRMILQTCTQTLEHVNKHVCQHTARHRITPIKIIHIYTRALEDVSQNAYQGEEFLD